MSRSSYQSPSAFRQALTDRLRAKSRDGRWTLMQLQRQIAYDRLLERLYLTDDRWWSREQLRCWRGDSQ